MEDLDKIKDQLKTLLSLVKNTTKENLEVDIYLQIYSFKETERDSKKVYMMSLCDQESKFNSFFLASNEDIPGLKEGKLIHLKEISPKKIKNSMFIRIKEYELISEPFELKEVKEIKLEDIAPEENKIITNGEKEINSEKKEMEIEETPVTLSEDAYTSLKQLTTFSRDFIIFVRVTKKSEIKTFETRNNNMGSSQGKLFYFIVLDRDGNEMQCTCFNKAVDKFFDIIEEDQLYEIKGGYDKLNDKKYTRIKSDYKIVLDENSKITKKADNGIIKKNNMTIIRIKDIPNMNLYSIVDLCVVVLNVGEKMIKNTRNGSQPLKKIDNGTIKKSNMNIVRIKDIQNMNLYSIVDLCVVVLNVGEKMIKNTRNGSQPLKKIVVGDVSKYKIEISLWRVHSDTNVKFGDILLINNVKIGEYKGRTLTTFDETCTKINPPLTNEYV